MGTSVEEPVTESPLFEVEIVRDGRTFAPRSLDEIEAWLQREKACWSWLPAARKEDQALDYVVNYIYSSLDTITQTLEEAKAARVSSPEQLKRNIGQLNSQLTDRLTERKTPTFETPIAHFVSDLAKTDNVAAAHALWASLGNDSQGTNRPARALHGQILASLHRAERGTLSASAQAAWSETQERVHNEHAVLRKEAGKISDDFRALCSEITTLQVEHKRLYDEAHARRTTEFDSLKASHSAEMAKIESTFRRELSLRSAVQYLDQKATQHRNAATKAAWAAAIVGAVLATIAIVAVVLVFKDGKDIPVSQVSVAVLLATLMFWLLRILVRVLLSNLHLETDMRARSTFVHTYLALLAEGAGIKDEDRALVIGLVFRPISDGLVRDDATPPGLWDLVTKNLSARS